MRKRILTLLCIIMLLAIGLAGLVGCVGGEIILPGNDPTPEQKPDDPNKPTAPTQVTFSFSPIVFDGKPYNGEIGVGTDVYIANLKASVKVSEGECMANVTIKSVMITLKINDVASEPRLATDEEMAKFSLSEPVIKNVTTEAREIVIKVVFGNFHDDMYKGASFNFELQADPYIV